MSQPSFTANLCTRSSGTVHAGRDGQPLCPTRARTASYSETRLDVTCKHCLRIAAATVTTTVTQPDAASTPAAKVAKPERVIPASVEARAAKAGLVAMRNYKIEWEAEVRAHENERNDVEAGVTRPVAWLAEDPCPAWCVGALDHDNSTHPDDRAHYGSTSTVELVTMAPIVVSYPSRFAQPEVMVSLDQKYREREPRVCLTVEDMFDVYATLDEAEQLASELLALVRAARGWSVPAAMLFDAEGRCPDMACKNCYPVQGEVSA